MVPNLKILSSRVATRVILLSNTGSSEIQELVLNYQRKLDGNWPGTFDKICHGFPEEDLLCAKQRSLYVPGFGYSPAGDTPPSDDALPYR